MPSTNSSGLPRSPRSGPADSTPRWSGGVARRLLLVQAFERAVSDRSCQLFTVLGTAGAGKSASSRSSSARSMSLRCSRVGVSLRGWHHVLPGGGGDQKGARTRGLRRRVECAGTDPRLGRNARTRRCHHGESREAPRRRARPASRGDVLVDPTVLGDPRVESSRSRSSSMTSTGEKQTFLDLIEHVADWSRDAQILLLCMARPDLAGRATGMGGGKTNATTISLAPLTEHETTELIDHLLGEAGFPTEVRARIAAMAEGNPLFVEEMLRMLIDDGLLLRTAMLGAVGRPRKGEHPADHIGAAFGAARPAVGSRATGDRAPAIEGRVSPQERGHTASPRDRESSRR